MQADFRTVPGLLTGNNVRLGGIAVGTVKAVRILNDTTVRVEMRLNQDVRGFVRKNAVAVIGTDGLVGNSIINLNPDAGSALLIIPNDVLATRPPVSMDAMLGTLDVSNRNLVATAHDLRQMAARLDSSAMWQVLGDRQLPGSISQSLSNVAAATVELHTAAADVAQLTNGIRRGQGPLGYLLTDEVLPGQLRHAGRQLAATSDTLAAALTGLQGQLRTGGGPVQTLLTDTALSEQLRQSMRNVTQSTQKLGQSMEALQHNFLLRGYFRQQARQQAKQQPAPSGSRPAFWGHGSSWGSN